MARAASVHGANHAMMRRASGGGALSKRAVANPVGTQREIEITPQATRAPALPAGWLT